MITFIEMAIQGFRSFKNDQVFRFYQSGFNLVKGENRMEPDLGANGAGKSSLFDALCWVLTGRSSRGLRGPDLSNWEGYSLTSVALVFDKDGTLYELCRSWNPNTLTLAEGGGEPVAVTQEELEDLTGLSFSTVLCTLLLGQFNRFFFDLSPSEKLDLFAGALKLDVWSEAVQNAKRAADEFEVERSLAAQGLSNALATRRLLKKQLLDLERKRDKHRLESVKALKEARKQKEVAERRLADSSRELEEVNAQIREVEKARSEIAKESERVRKRMMDLKDAHRAETSKLELVVEKKNDLSEATGVLSDIRGCECPTCKQKVPVQHVDRFLSTCKPLFKDLESRIRESRARLEVIENELSEVVSKIKELDKEDKRLVGVLGNLRLSSDRIRDEVSKARAGVESAKKKVESLKKEDNPYDKLIEETVTKIRGARRKYNLQRKRRDLAARKIEECLFWKKEFGNLRLSVVDEALDELQVEISSALVHLGLKGWEVSFAVEREKKSGGITKGFSVMIKSPSVEKPVRWESWCGGETQRLRIAGAIGLSALVCSRQGIDLSLEVWDEPTAHLSSEGIEDLLDFFSLRARELKKEIHLIDHRTLNYGGFDAITRVIKDDVGSKIVQ